MQGKPASLEQHKILYVKKEKEKKKMKNSKEKRKISITKKSEIKTYMQKIKQKLNKKSLFTRHLTYTGEKR